MKDAALRPTPNRIGADYWPTPYCLRLMLHRIIKEKVPSHWLLWEPAAGAGTLLTGLPHPLYLSDKYPLDRNVDERDFLAGVPEEIDPNTWVVTNPPYNQLDAFIEAGVQAMRARKVLGVTLLIRLDHLGAAKRSAWLNSASQIDIACWRPRWIEGSTGNGRWTNAWVTWARDNPACPITRFWTRDQLCE
jgi:hypothetical protein